MCTGSGEMNSEVLHLTTSQNAPCPRKPCLTLNHFASNDSLKHNVNVTLIFQAGNHSLDSEISITNISEFNTFSNSTLHQRVTVICNSSGKFNLNNIDYVRISGLHFISCGNNRFAGVNHLTIYNTTYQHWNGSGTVLELVETTASIVKSSFISNRIGGYRGPIKILESLNNEQDLSISTYVWCGGALIATNSNVTIVGSTFVDNIAGLAGAMYADKGSNITIVNSVFERNHAVSFGGVVYIESNIYNQTKCLTKLSILKSNFISNSASGGSVIAAYHSIVNITASNFCGNKSLASGGVVWAQSETTLNVSDSEFVGNSVHGKTNSNGGVIVMFDNSMLFINNSQLIATCHSTVGSNVVG